MLSKFSWPWKNKKWWKKQTMFIRNVQRAKCWQHLKLIIDLPIYQTRSWHLKYLWSFHPERFGTWSNLTCAYFSDGLVKNPPIYERFPDSFSRHFTLEPSSESKNCGSKWVFPKIGVPQNGWFIMENPIKMDDLGVPLFLETPKYEKLWI